MQDVFFSSLESLNKALMCLCICLFPSKLLVYIGTPPKEKKKKKRKVVDNIKQKIILITDIDSRTRLALMFSMSCESECSNVL